MKYFLLSLLTLTVGINLFGQNSFIVSYPVSFPRGDLLDYISEPSFRGINVEFVREVKPNIAVGIETGWNVFYENAGKMDYKQGTGTISGVQFRYTNSVPILAQTKYVLQNSNKKMNPYFGLGVGTLYVDRSTDFGLYRISTHTWQFLVRPEAGLLFQLQSGVKALIGAKYYAAVSSSDLDAQSFLSLNVGFVFASQ